MGCARSRPIDPATDATGERDVVEDDANAGDAPDELDRDVSRTSPSSASASGRGRATRGVEKAFLDRAVATESDAEWRRAKEPTPWTGPATPTRACETDVETFYVDDEVKRTFGGMPVYPWEGEAWTAPGILAIIEHGLTCANVDVKLGRPCTLKMSEDEQIEHLRNAIADVMQTTQFEFAMRVFEGAETPPREACRRFLRRLCQATHGGVYCKLRLVHKTKAACLAHAHDSKYLGAALYTRVFMLRFCKRFPPQFGFVHPEIDAPATRTEMTRKLSDTFDMYKVWPASEGHPTMLFGFLTNDGLKKMLTLSARDSWFAVNQMYEYVLGDPSENLSGKLPLFIIDVKKVSVTMFSRSFLSAVSKQFAVAEFHPEPFAHFILTNTPFLLAALWSVGKLLLTESARYKFVICTGDATAEIQTRYGVEKKLQPVECGGAVTDALVRSEQWLSVVAHENAVKAITNTMNARKSMNISRFPGTVSVSPRKRAKKSAKLPKLPFTTGIRPIPIGALSVSFLVRAIEFALVLALLALILGSSLRRLFALDWR